MNKELFKKDILAFADDDSEVIIDNAGEILYYKNGTEQICKLKTNLEGNHIVEVEGQDIPYRTFISKNLARLDIFAKKLLDKRSALDTFVDGPALLKTVHSEKDGGALELLMKECDDFLEFGSKINFITADAGLGKSVLLKQFQYIQANRYSKNESNYIFWHIDLQGRDLVRLAEAIMYDLGDLRLPGLYYPSIINLIQKRLIILAIDGFDELAAEIGGVNAVSSLSSLVNEMEGQGTLVAASRRTFFDTHDYLKRTNLLQNKVPFDIIFNELKLRDWTKTEAIKYFELLDFENPQLVYDSIVTELHDINHPILTRPFLLTKLASAIAKDNFNIQQFFTNNTNQQEGVAIIVEAFTTREVDKWKEKDTVTGKPYLNFEQHIEFLSMISKEMWEAKRDYVTIEEIEFHAASLIDEWKIEESIRPTIMRLVKSHAFLIPVQDNKYDIRKFDHEEFQKYFLSRALALLMNKCIQEKNYSDLGKFLYIDQLSDSVAMYCFNYVIDLNENVQSILNAFKELIDKEWKPTYLQMNIGTLIPYMIDKINSDEILEFSAKVNYSSLIFESKNLKNITFENGNFINISLRNTQLDNVSFVSCNFNEIKIETSSNNVFNNVILKDCEISTIFLLKDGDVREVAYSPERISELLIQNKFIIQDKNNNIIEIQDSQKENEFKKALIRFIIKFNKMTIQYEKNIIDERYFGNDNELIHKEVIPLLEEFEVIKIVDTKQSRQSSSKAWRLVIDMEQLMKHDGDNSDNNLSKFWEIVNKKK